jgi:hypothetical protein
LDEPDGRRFAPGLGSIHDLSHKLIVVMSLDNLAERIAGFGVPVLVLLVSTSATGYSGAARLTTALSDLGGPVGMAGGVAMLSLLSWILAALNG